MKTGMIVYVVGKAPVGEDIDFGAEVKKVHRGADRIEIVSSDTGHFDVADAWSSLTAKGMQSIFCIVGEMNAAGGLRLQERILRLCG